MDPLRDFAIPYDTLVPGPGQLDYDALAQHLAEALPWEWVDAYAAMSSHEPNVLEFKDHGFVYLFDFTSGGAAGADPSPDVPEDRVVAVYGRTQPGHGAKRDASRMRGFLGGGLADARGERRDKGHFLAHSLGGGLDVNLFPQSVAVNRGRSERGKTFRRMERYGATHSSTFVFARPIYGDLTWTPLAFEYGLLLPAPRLWVERFPN